MSNRLAIWLPDFHHCHPIASAAGQVEAVGTLLSLGVAMFGEFGNRLAVDQEEAGGIDNPGELGVLVGLLEWVRHLADRPDDHHWLVCGRVG